MAEHHVLREGIIEHPETGAHHGSTFSGDVPDEADARGEILLVWVVELAQTGLTHLRESEVRVGEIKTGDIAEKIVLLANHAEVVPTKAIIQSQPRRQAEAVLGIETEVVFKRVAGRGSEVLKTAIDSAGEEIG